MITKLTWALRKWENGSVKGKREKGKGFSISHFRFKTNKAHFPPASMNPNTPLVTYLQYFGQYLGVLVNLPLKQNQSVDRHIQRYRALLPAWELEPGSFCFFLSIHCIKRLPSEQKIISCPSFTTGLYYKQSSNLC